MTPTEKTIQEQGSAQLYPATSGQQGIVTKAMFDTRPDIRLLVLLTDLTKEKELRRKKEMIAIASTQLLRLDPWRYHETYIIFFRTIAPLAPKVAQSALNTYLERCIKAPFSRKKIREPKDHLWEPLIKQSADYRAVFLAQMSVLAKELGISAKKYHRAIATMIREAKAPYQGNVGAVIVGLHYAGYVVTPLLKWAVTVVKNEEEYDYKERPWRVVVAQCFATIALFVGDIKHYATFLSMTTPANARAVEKIRKLTGDKYDRAIKNMLYLNWKPFKEMTAKRIKKYIPNGDDIYDRVPSNH